MEDYITREKAVRMPKDGVRADKKYNMLNLPKSSGVHKIHHINYPKLGLNLVEI